MDSEAFRERILPHHRDPQNYGKIAESDFEHAGSHAACGESVRLFVRLESETVERVTFVGNGCAIGRAAASLLTEDLRGRTLKEVRGLDDGHAADVLGMDLTPRRRRCATLPLRVAREGAAVYQGDRQDVETTGI